MSAPEMKISREYQAVVRDTLESAVEGLKDATPEQQSLGELMATVLAGIGTLVLLAEGQLNAQAIIAERIAYATGE